MNDDKLASTEATGIGGFARLAQEEDSLSRGCRIDRIIAARSD